MKRLLLHFAALAGLLLPATATAAESTTVLAPVKLLGDSVYFSKFTYDWVNDAGQTCTARLTDVATDPRQIYAMIAKVYTDPDIPGKIKVTPIEGEKVGTVSNVVSYSGKAWEHWNTNGNKNAINVNENIPTPKVDEQTMLLVEVKDKFDTDGATRYHDNSTIACIYHCIKSVRLLYNAFRIERDGQGYSAGNTSYKPGVVYNVSGTYNRFFLMGKGSNRPELKGEPFDRMFEQYSPSTGVDSIPATDFYQQLKSGHSYTVKHDCGTVPHLGHFPTMASASSTAGAETMSNLMVFIPDYRLVSWSGRDANGLPWCYYNPTYIPLFQVYDIKLSAKAERYGQESDRKFNVTLDWTSNIDTLSDTRVKQDFYIYRVVNGVIDSMPLNKEPLNSYTYSYLVPQNESGQTLTYIVTGRPSGISGFNPVESNQASVMIPGYDPYERLALDIKATSRSKYDPQSQVNEYTNHIVMDNNAYTHVTGDFVKVGTEFHLYRFDNDNDGSEKTEIATITIQSIASNGNAYNFNYKMEMKNQAEAVSPAYGKFTAASAKGIIDFNSLEVADHFTASTAANAQADHYDYVLTFMPVVAAGSEGVKEIYSNVARITVPKTEFTVGMTPYTKAQVDGDTEHTLALPDGMHMTVAAANSTDVRSYTLYRGNTAFADMQRADNGTYSILTRCEGSQRPDQAVANGLGAGWLTATDDLRDATVGANTFYPVINAECTLADGTVGTNTYGADQKLATPLSVKVENPTTMSTKPFAYDATSWKMGFACAFKANGIFDKDSMGEYNYRVWRIDDDGTETMLTEGMYDDDSNPNVTGNYKFYIDGGDLDVSDLFIDNPLSATASKTVNYIVRLYCQGTANQSKFYVAEDRFSVTFDASTPTGLDEVLKPAAGVASVRYIDATGRQSLTPMTGFNIVVTTLTDGTVTTGKLIKR